MPISSPHVLHRRSVASSARNASGGNAMTWIEVNGTSLRYELSGSGKTTLVLVHEMGGTLDSWDRVLPALNNTRQVLRYDTRGAGLSEKIRGTVSFAAPRSAVRSRFISLGVTQHALVPLW